MLGASHDSSKMSWAEMRTPNAPAVKRARRRQVSFASPRLTEITSRIPRAEARHAAATTPIPSTPFGAIARICGRIFVITGACSQVCRNLKEI